MFVPKGHGTGLKTSPVDNYNSFSHVIKCNTLDLLCNNVELLFLINIFINLYIYKIMLQLTLAFNASVILCVVFMCNLHMQFLHDFGNRNHVICLRVSLFCLWDFSWPELLDLVYKFEIRESLSISWSRENLNNYITRNTSSSKLST